MRLPGFVLFSFFKKLSVSAPPSPAPYPPSHWNVSFLRAGLRLLCSLRSPKFLEQQQAWCGCWVAPSYVSTLTLNQTLCSLCFSVSIFQFSKRHAFSYPKASVHALFSLQNFPHPPSLIYLKAFYFFFFLIFKLADQFLIHGKPSPVYINIYFMFFFIVQIYIHLYDYGMVSLPHPSDSQLAGPKSVWTHPLLHPGQCLAHSRYPCAQ